MNSYRIYLALACCGICLSFFSCNKPNSKTTMNKPMSTKNMYMQLAEKQLGDSLEYSFNAPQTYVLCIKTDKNAPLPMQARQNDSSPDKSKAGKATKTGFVVIKLADNSIVYQNSIFGHIKWHDDSNLEIFEITGAKSDTPTYWYNVVSKRRVATGSPQE